MRATYNISSLILAVLLLLGGLTFPFISSAQSAETECDLPDFQISSDDQVYAITDESFSYYVVTANDTSYQLTSSLPTGLSFSGEQVFGTPQAAGDYTLEFTAQNSCGETVQTVNLTVVSSSSAVAQGSTNQSANVGLNEIPDTGLEADSALTISFYVLSLLAIAGWFTRKVFTPAAVSVGGGDYEGDDHQSFAEVMRGSFIPRGQSIVSETVRKTAKARPQPKKTQPTQSQTQTYRFGDGIRRP